MHNAEYVRLRRWWDRMNGRYWVPFYWGHSCRGWTMAVFHRRLWREWLAEHNDCSGADGNG